MGTRKSAFGRNYRTTLTAGNHKGEQNTLPSLTQPNMVVSMRELLSRHAMGITDNVQQQTQYSGDLPDLRGLEPHELRDQLKATQERTKQLQALSESQVIEIRKEKEKAKREAQEIAFKDWEAKVRAQKMTTKE